MLSQEPVFQTDPTHSASERNSPLHNRIWLLETHLHQAVQELRDAANLMQQCDMPKTAEYFNKAADYKAVALGDDDV